MKIHSAGLSDVGLKRRINQDCFGIEDKLQLYIVADGMGGHLAGEVAARTVVDTVRNYFVALNGNRKTPWGRTLGDSPDREANHLRDAIVLANAQVYQASIDRPEHRGMGSTVAVLRFAADTFVAANVGDSSIYWIHEDRIECISVPHTVVAEHSRTDSELTALYGPDFRHMLTRGVGITAEVEPDFYQSEYTDGDRFVICSDGLSDKVPPDEIFKIASRGPLSKICRTLVDLANERGGDDNTTVVMLAVGTARDFWSHIAHKIAQFFK